VIEAKALSVSFGSTMALRDVSLSVEAGESVAVMGRSGSGKSTLLHCLAGLVRPDQGEVWFDGRRLDSASEKTRSDERLRHMGLVFQFGYLAPELTLAENVALPLLVTGTSRRAAQQRAMELLERLEASDVADRRPSEVSGGQMQRAAVARALAHRPRVVFADEPTGALDSANGQLVLEAMITAARDDRAAVVVVTHEARLASYCDREVVLVDGVIE
jgi:putative ABC transport system ATP-binding protein